MADGSVVTLFDPYAVRAQFPILSRQVNGKPLVYLDSGASAQKPRVVIDAITRAYEGEYANVHRGLHYLSNLATENYERVRGIIARFLNAPREDEVIFTSGSTEGINLVSYAWAAPRLQAGDEIVLSVLEHHANIVPWQLVAERTGATIRVAELLPDGSLDLEALHTAMTPEVKLLGCSHVSNVLGTVNPVREICREARRRGIAGHRNRVAAPPTSSTRSSDLSRTRGLRMPCWWKSASVFESSCARSRGEIDCDALGGS